jgi:Uma2 family endonuclease
MALADEIHLLGIDDYLALAEITNLERTELIEGVIYDMAPESRHHRDPVEEIFVRLRTLIGPRVHMAGSVQITSNTMCQPDIYVERPEVDGSRLYPTAADVELVIEVVQSSWTRDMGPKLKMYATAQIPWYWVLTDVTTYLHGEPAAGAYTMVDRIELAPAHLPIEQLWNSRHLSWE